METNRTILTISFLNSGVRKSLSTPEEVEGSPGLYYSLRGIVQRGYHVEGVFVTPEDLHNAKMDTWGGLTAYFVRETSYHCSNRWKTTRVLDYILRRIGGAITVVHCFLTSLRVAWKIKPCLIYGHGSYAPVAFFVASIIGVPNIRRVYGTLLYPEVSDRRFISKLRATIRHPLRVSTFLLPSAGLIITNDGTRGDIVARTFGVNPGKIHFWHSGVDFDAFDKVIDRNELRSELGLPENSLLIANVSRLVDWKRVDRVIEAFALVAPSRETSLIIIGDGPERTKLGRLCIKLEIERRVMFRGSVALQGISDFLLASDIYVSAYDFSNLSNTLIEAMAAGKAIVTLDDGSTQGLLEDGHNALLVSPSAEAIASAITSLVEDSSLRDKIGQRVKATARSTFLSWEERIEREISFIEEVIQRHA